MMDGYYSDSIFWVEVDRIKPNPFQPRRTFDEAALASLAESIRQYGVLNPLTVTRHEIERSGEGVFVEYELIAGERRLRAAKLAGVAQVPVVIRNPEESDAMKLELAIIENLQREDLTPIDRAKAFRQLVDEFGLKHSEIGKKIGKSREYVSNTMRILLLPQDIQEALASGELTEGHTRPLLMLAERPEEQHTLFKEIIQKRLTVRDTEQVARRIATERVRKFDLTPDLLALERQLTEMLGTRVRIEKKDTGGKVLIDFFSPDDLAHLCMQLAVQNRKPTSPTVQELSSQTPLTPTTPESAMSDLVGHSFVEGNQATAETPTSSSSENEDDMYSVKNFTV